MAEEEKYDLGGEGGMVLQKGKFGRWLDNFWYHYKWIAIGVLVLVIFVTVCTVQMCGKEDYDVYIIYAGSADVRTHKADNDISDYETLHKSVNEAVEDFDENGRVTSSFDALFMLSSEERKKIEQELADMKDKGEGSYELNYVQLNENDKVFRDRIMLSDYYVFLISEPIYNAYQVNEDGVSTFAPIRELCDEGVTVEFLDDCAVYLHSTEFGSLPGLCDLPENTLITLRSRGAFSSHFNKEETEMHYQNAVTVVKNMINYGG